VKPSLKVSSPPEFRGEAGYWTPEDLFVASVETCHMATFLSFASRKQLLIVSYKSHAMASLSISTATIVLRVVVIFPTIVVSRSVPEAEVHAALREAEKHCLVANSIASIVEVNPTLVIE